MIPHNDWALIFFLIWEEKFMKQQMDSEKRLKQKHFVYYS